ncbi:hypothetical protein C4D60_Mb09t06650 [Musa balbisiana]|uniref:Small EDRK-rich factor-like N-terminal domain-containing protein n=1 Tax=Musa balbisiana TaxID=52838 RepID=A0A4S8IGX4_MUSBA|nr:hypothetical protein C4D60_Mb09t06650 [Musa balbisiana]
MKQRDDGLTPEQRRERDAKALQEKAAKKAAQAAVGGGTTDSKNKGSAKNSRIGQCVQSVSAEKTDTAEFQSSAGIGACMTSAALSNLASSIRAHHHLQLLDRLRICLHTAKTQHLPQPSSG